VKMQLAGRALPGDALRIVDGSVEEGRFVALYHREERLAAVLGWNRPRVVMQYRKELREAGVV
jgi:3-phenylpropionate/trans-cinnamate dioxygenase ferredoxin reductase subunit